MFSTAKSFKVTLVVLCTMTVSLISVFTEPDVALTQFSSPISTPTSTPDPTKNNPMVLFYAETFNLDYDEAERRLIIRDEMGVVERELFEEDEAYFASWVQHVPEFGLVVSFTTADGDERIRKYLVDVDWADLVTVVQSNMTRQEIADLREKVVTEARKTGIRFGADINYPEGKITLNTEKPNELRTALEANPETAPIMDKIEIIQGTGDTPATQSDEHKYYLPCIPIVTVTLMIILGITLKQV